MQNTQTQIERLADGELSPRDQAQLLTALDSTPDGWRRCALALLEARALGQSFKLLLNETAQQAPATVETHPDRERQAERRRPRWKPIFESLAIAAGLLLAYALGLSGDPRSDTSPQANQVVDQFPPTLEPTAAEGLLAQQDPEEETVTFWVHDSRGKKQSLRVPLVDAELLNERYGLEFRSAVPDELREDLRRRGYQLTTKQRYAPLFLEGGRPFVVPVEDTQITPQRVELL